MQVRLRRIKHRLPWLVEVSRNGKDWIGVDMHRHEAQAKIQAVKIKLERGTDYDGQAN